MDRGLRTGVSFFGGCAGKTPHKGEKYKGLFPIAVSTPGAKLLGWDTVVDDWESTDRVINAADVGIMSFGDVLSSPAFGAADEHFHWFSKFCKTPKYSGTFAIQLDALLQVYTGVLAKVFTSLKSTGVHDYAQNAYGTADVMFGALARCDHPVVKVVSRIESAVRTDTLWFLTGIPAIFGGASYIVYPHICADVDSPVRSVFNGYPNDNISALHEHVNMLDIVKDIPYYFWINNAMLVGGRAFHQRRSTRVFYAKKRGKSVDGVLVEAEDTIHSTIEQKASEGGSLLDARSMQDVVFNYLHVIGKGSTPISSLMADSTDIVDVFAPLLILGDDLW